MVVTSAPRPWWEGLGEGVDCYTITNKVGGEVPLYVLLLIAFASLIASAISYFFAKIKLFSFTLLLFYTCNTFFSFCLIHNNHAFFFYTIVIFLIIFPIICLILFALDVYYGLFCIDTSFVLFLVWLLTPVLFIVNLVSHILKVIHA